jgi:hypothetical protein
MRNEEGFGNLYLNTKNWFEMKEEKLNTIQKRANFSMKILRTIGEAVKGYESKARQYLIEKVYRKWIKDKGKIGDLLIKAERKIREETDEISNVKIKDVNQEENHLLNAITGRLDMVRTVDYFKKLKKNNVWRM